MCNCKSVLSRKKINNVEQLRLVVNSTTAANLRRPLPEKREISPDPTQQRDMFQVYSSKGVVAAELESFGIIRTSRRSSRQENTERKSRKSRVSTEVYPDLLLAPDLFEDNDELKSSSSMLSIEDLLFSL